MADTAKSRVYPAVIIVLLLIIAGMAYKFIVIGSTVKTEGWARGSPLGAR
jgi:hypothetical protein